MKVECTLVFRAVLLTVAKNGKNPYIRYRWTVKQSVVHPCHRVLLSNKKRWTTDNESPEKYAEWKKPIHKGYLLYDSIYVTLLKWQHGNGKQICGRQGLKRAGGGRWEVGPTQAACGVRVMVETFRVPCQYPGWDTALEIRKMFPLGKAVLFYNHMWIYSYLKIKHFIKKEK